MRVACVGAKRTDSLDRRVQPAEDLAEDIRNLCWQVRPIRRQIKRLANRPVEALDVLGYRQRQAQLDQDRAANALDRRAGGGDGILWGGLGALQSSINVASHRVKVDDVELGGERADNLPSLVGISEADLFPTGR